MRPLQRLIKHLDNSIMNQTAWIGLTLPFYRIVSLCLTLHFMEILHSKKQKQVHLDISSVLKPSFHRWGHYTVNFNCAQEFLYIIRLVKATSWSRSWCWASAREYQFVVRIFLDARSPKWVNNESAKRAGIAFFEHFNVVLCISLRIGKPCFLFMFLPSHVDSRLLFND